MRLPTSLYCFRNVPRCAQILLSLSIRLMRLTMRFQRSAAWLLFFCLRRHGHATDRGDMIELKASRLNQLNSTSNAIVHLFATMPFLHFAKAGFSIFATMPFLHLAKTSFPSSQLCLFFISRRQVFHLRNYVFSSFREIMFSSKTALAIYNEPLPKTRIKGPKRQKGGATSAIWTLVFLTDVILFS